MARRWLVQILEQRGLTHLSDTASLLVSELVTNALSHSVGPYELILALTSRCATVSVSDSAGAERGRPRRADTDALAASDELPEHGRGLLLVAELSDGWGWQWTASGKRVWFRLALRPDPDDPDGEDDGAGTSLWRPLPR